MATFTKRTNKAGIKTWMVSIRVKGAKPIYKTFTKKIIAQNWARDTEGAIEKGKYTDYSRADNYLVSEALDRYASEILITRAANTVRSATPKLRRLGVEFKNITLSKLSSTAIIDFVDKCKRKNLKDGTINQYLNLINLTIKACNSVWDITCTNPVPIALEKCRLTRKLTTDKGRDRRPSQDEIENILNFTKYKPLNIICELAIETAMRRSEILRIERQHINYIDRTLIISITKTGVPRTIPLTTRATEILREQTKNSIRIDGRLFAIRPDTLTNQFSKMCKELKIVDLVFHDLRHEAASRLFELGVFDIMEVAHITGHKSLSMLKRYTHLKPENLAKKLA